MLETREIESYYHTLARGMENLYCTLLSEALVTRGVDQSTATDASVAIVHKSCEGMQLEEAGMNLATMVLVLHGRSYYSRYANSLNSWIPGAMESGELSGLAIWGKEELFPELFTNPNLSSGQSEMLAHKFMVKCKLFNLHVCMGFDPWVCVKIPVRRGSGENYHYEIDLDNDNIMITENSEVIVNGSIMKLIIEIVSSGEYVIINENEHKRFMRSEDVGTMKQLFEYEIAMVKYDLDMVSKRYGY